MGELFPDEPQAPAPGMGLPGERDGFSEPGEILRDKADDIRHEARHMAQSAGDEAERIASKVKETAGKAAHQVGDALGTAKQKGGEFLSTPAGKNTAIGAGALTAVGLAAKRIRHHEPSHPQRRITSPLHFRRS